ncbi:hypothetical protein [Micropruina sp.]|uniref:hypothetical protein n=1 Tax=Micropruina sp. TaxID=2737536 RepID=UPI0039E38746
MSHMLVHHKEGEQNRGHQVMRVGLTAAGAIALLVLGGCSNLPPLTTTRPPAVTTSPTSSTASSPTLTPGATTSVADPETAKCKPLSRSLLNEANERGRLGKAARFTSGQMVKASDHWWFVAARATTEPGYEKVNGIRNGRMAFVTNQPSGGSSWVPLSDALVQSGDWDGTLPNGDEIPDWEAFRATALKCLS